MLTFVALKTIRGQKCPNEFIDARRGPLPPWEITKHFTITITP